MSSPSRSACKIYETLKHLSMQHIANPDVFQAKVLEMLNALPQTNTLKY